MRIKISPSRLPLLTALTGALAPFATGLIVRAVLQALGEEVLEAGLILKLIHVWVLMGIALALASLPAALLLRRLCRDDRITPVAWGMFLGFVITVIALFSIGWIDANSLIEGFALAAPIWVALMAAFYTVGALAGAGLGYIVGRIIRVNREAFKDAD